MVKEINRLIEQMTLEEKVTMTAGADNWRTVAIERLGIPAFKVTDGPNGARGENAGGGGITSLCMPAGICLASTWNTNLIHQVGSVLGEEVRSKCAQMLLAPTVNIHRSPLNGRNFECYSEDPFLTAQIAAAFINGLKEQKIGASIKHYVCNDSEFERRTISSEVDERALREIYLLPFEMAVAEADPWAVMASYNKINGTYASENAYTLNEILKKEWGFKGFVVSDWGGTYSAIDPAIAGLDLEMPGPGRFFGEQLLEAIKTGKVDETIIDDKVRRILRAIFQSGIRENPPEDTEKAVDLPEHRHVAYDAAVEGMVLLKNDNHTLPLSTESLKSIAIIGPNAKVARIGGGGSATVRPHYNVTPYDGIIERIDSSFTVNYEPGCTNHRLLPVLNPEWAFTDTSKTTHGFRIDYHISTDLSGEPVFTTKRTYMDLTWVEPVSPDVDLNRFSARFTAVFTPPVTGTYSFGIISSGAIRLTIDGKSLIDTWPPSPAEDRIPRSYDGEMTAQCDLTEGKDIRIQLDFSTQGTDDLLKHIRLGCLPHLPVDAMDRAAKAAAQSNVALVFVGTSNEWETEGRDRPDMELPGQQAELIEKVASANSNTVVILNTGSPVSMDWADRVPAILEAWFPGQECGNAIADILFGNANPSGKLSQTFPYRLEDNPAYINYPGENGQVRYGEGIFVGYRYYEKKKIAPRFPFGHGLSYTTFEYSNLQLNAEEYAPEDKIKVSVDITNTGDRSGKEIVQLYIHDPESSLARPEKELKAFEKVLLAPGETKTIHFTLDHRSLAFYDPAQKAWVAEPGIFYVLIGSSSADIRITGNFSLKE